MIHSIPYFIQGKADSLVMDCATGGDATSGGTITGSIIDRYALGRQFTHYQPVASCVHTGNTSTNGAKSFKLDCFLQHGDSSAGGDMAEVNTGLRVDQQVYFNTGELTTDYKVWTTGTVRGQISGQAYPYSTGLKRFIRGCAIVTKLGLSTATTGAQNVLADIGVNALRADYEPPTRLSLADPAGTKAPLYATSTNT